MNHHRRNQRKRKLETIGDISVNQDRICWKIQNFFCSSFSDDKMRIISPEFFIMDKYCRLYVQLPQCINSITEDSYLIIGISESSCLFQRWVTVSPSASKFNLQLGIAGKNEEVSRFHTACDKIKYQEEFFNLLEFEEEKEEWVPEGNLHLFCAVKKARDKLEAKKHSSREMGIMKLQADFKDTLEKGNFSDIVLKVENREFKSHRCILSARSPVFFAMLTHEMKEKNTGVIDIKDVHADTLACFLEYLYSGNIENITPEIAEKLYRTADKYQVNELKSICMEHMLKNIRVENFCDLLTLSLLHEAENLKEKCTQFFIENSLAIVKTTKWKTFLSENPMIGNELYMKQLEINNE